MHFNPKALLILAGFAVLVAVAVRQSALEDDE